MIPKRRLPVPMVTLLLATVAACAPDSPAAEEPAGSSPALGPTSMTGSWASSGDAALFPDLDAFTGLPSSPRGSASSAFWDHWGDGRAELSGYRLRVERYREVREGETALIYVTEPHDRRTWVKDDDVESPHRVEVLKLIRSSHFLTGVYPYSVHSSLFAPVDDWGRARFQPVRVQLDVQEWCGAVSHRVWPGEGRLRSLRLSYFASEGETLREVELPEGTLFEEALLVQLRELDGPFQGGEDWEGWLVPDLWRLRTGHGPVEPVRASITRIEATRDGEDVTRFVLESEGYRRSFDVERDPPRRILGWETSTGETAELLRTERLAYWGLNRSGDEEVREGLGLQPVGPVPPGMIPSGC